MLLHRTVNQSFTLPCTYTGYPPGTIRWIIGEWCSVILFVFLILTAFGLILFPLKGNILFSNNFSSKANMTTTNNTTHEGWQGIELRRTRQKGDTLYIAKLTLSHSNLYTCAVDNSYTSHEQSILLQVRGKYFSMFLYDFFRDLFW